MWSWVMAPPGVHLLKIPGDDGDFTVKWTVKDQLNHAAFRVRSSSP